MRIHSGRFYLTFSSNIKHNFNITSNTANEQTTTTITMTMISSNTMKNNSTTSIMRFVVVCMSMFVSLTTMTTTTILAFSSKPIIIAPSSSSKASAQQQIIIAPISQLSQQQQQRSRLRSTSLSLAPPTDIADSISLLSFNPDIQAEILSDISNVIMNAAVFVPNLKTTQKLRMKCLEVVGRMLVLTIGVLPHHQMNTEELLVQLFLLGVNMKPILRSIQLFRCISSSSTTTNSNNCTSTTFEECLLDLDTTLDDTNNRTIIMY